MKILELVRLLLSMDPDREVKLFEAEIEYGDYNMDHIHTMAFKIAIDNRRKNLNRIIGKLKNSTKKKRKKNERTP